MWRRRPKGDRVEVIRPVGGLTKAQWAQSDEDMERMARDLPLRDHRTGIPRDDWDHKPAGYGSPEYVEALIVSLKAAGAGADEVSAARREANIPLGSVNPVRSVPDEQR